MIDWSDNRYDCYEELERQRKNRELVRYMNKRNAKILWGLFTIFCMFVSLIIFS